MPFKLPPDQSLRLVALEKKVAELERMTRRERPHNMRDHTDANLSQTANAVGVPTYDPTTGKWEIGAGGVVGCALIRGTNTAQACANGNSTTIDFNTIFSQYGNTGITPGGIAGTWNAPAGVYIIGAGITWFTSSSAGFRSLQINTPNNTTTGKSFVPGLDILPPTTDSQRHSIGGQPFYFVVADQVSVYALQTSGGSLNIDTTGDRSFLSILRLV